MVAFDSVKRNLFMLQFLVDNYRRGFCFGRFQRQLSHSIALRQFPNHVCPLTCGCTFIPDFTMSVAGLEPIEPFGHPNAYPNAECVRRVLYLEE
jgi:hypothetical protein